MKSHLPSRQESWELLALLIMSIGIHTLLGSWEWTTLFSLGFVWNWAVLNGWVIMRTQERRYRFSVLRAITVLHRWILWPFRRLEVIRHWASILPAALVFGVLSYSLKSPIPWWSILLGSLSFHLLRLQFSLFKK